MTDTVIGPFVLTDEIERFVPGPGESHRRAETLVKTDRLRVVLITMRAGATLHDHTAPGPITIQALQGRIRVSVNDDVHEMASGTMIAIEANMIHAVEAVEDGAFLLTISWPPHVTENDQQPHHAQHLRVPARVEAEDDQFPPRPYDESRSSRIDAL